MTVFLTLLACSPDFGLQAVSEKNPGGTDTAAETVADTAVDSTTDTGTTATTTPEETTTPDTTETTPPVDTGTVEDPAPEDDCDHTSDLIYVLSKDDEKLYTFDPASRQFTALGKVDCGTSLYPSSMAVSRTGIAYIRYENDAVYTLDLATFTCSASAYADRKTGFGSFGMGYATDDPTTWHEKLYVANDSDVGILDTNNWGIRTLGSLPSQSELTGNASGELWAMLPLERPAELRRLNTSTGATEQRLSLSGFPNPSNIDTFAFATWNGSFYLFVRLSGMGETTTVYEVAADGSLSRLLADTGLNVVGAGVSTCAPG